MEPTFNQPARDAMRVGNALDTCRPCCPLAAVLRERPVPTSVADSIRPKAVLPIGDFAAAKPTFKLPN
ncbi:hypothetical protein [Ideonella sp. A 288]|uniref:hypothetical protein n=1 Tax=Ideonella sp. A 288 TaxID=1962181 RepID=UPI0011857171|nr:hypothetical protein [Ideonella sp. A 288]